MAYVCGLSTYLYYTKQVFCIIHLSKVLKGWPSFWGLADMPTLTPTIIYIKNVTLYTINVSYLQPIQTFKNYFYKNFKTFKSNINIIKTSNHVWVSSTV